jgi:hypothetical protein
VLLGFPIQLLGLLMLPYLGIRYLVDGGDVAKDVETYTSTITKKLPGGEGGVGPQGQARCRRVGPMAGPTPPQSLKTAVHCRAGVEALAPRVRQSGSPTGPLSRAPAPHPALPASRPREEVSLAATEGRFLRQSLYPAEKYPLWLPSPNLNLGMLPCTNPPGPDVVLRLCTGITGAAAESAPHERCNMSIELRGVVQRSGVIVQNAAQRTQLSGAVLRRA